MRIISAVSPDIVIDHVDEHGVPEHFRISYGSFSYTVLPSAGAPSAADVFTIRHCAAPRHSTDGRVMMVALVHDPETARRLRQPPNGGWVGYLHPHAPATRAAPAEYHLATAFGSAGPVTAYSTDTPLFHRVFEDVTEDFLADGMPDQLDARVAMGTVHAVLAVDADPDRKWSAAASPGTVHVRTVASALDSLPPRERRGLLLEAGFPDERAFSLSSFREYGQTLHEARRLLSGDVLPLAPPDPELLHALRLHGDARIRAECYEAIARHAGEAVLAASMAPPAVTGPASSPLLPAI